MRPRLRHRKMCHTEPSLTQPLSHMYMYVFTPVHVWGICVPCYDHEKLDRTVGYCHMLVYINVGQNIYCTETTPLMMSYYMYFNLSSLKHWIQIFLHLDIVNVYTPVELFLFLLAFFFSPCLSSLLPSHSFSQMTFNLNSDSSYWYMSSFKHRNLSFGDIFSYTGVQESIKSPIETSYKCNG